MTQTEFLRDIVGRLHAAGIPFMLAGSFASSMYGEPRSTNDIDLVIDPSLEQLDLFVRRFDERYYVNRATALAAWHSRSMFNVIELTTGWKTDLILKQHRAFSEAEFERRQDRVVFGAAMSIVSPEDAILSKLEWAAKSGSDRQMRDVASMLKTRSGSLDWTYLDRWATELGLEALLAKAGE